MKERPILFSAPMVRAILEGRKTMTRRVVDARWQGFENVMPLPAVVEIASGGTMDFPGARPGDQLFYTDMPILDGAWQPVGCPYGQPGDRLWVRETWRYADWTEDGYPFIEYAATPGRMHLRENIPEDWDVKLEDIWAELSIPENYNIDGRAADRCWRPSIFMPSWAARITQELTAIRVERVQDISEYDAGLEGALCLAISKLKHPPIGLMQKIQAPEAFVYGFYDLWNSINDKRGYGWDANPWVWVVEFKRIEP